MIKIYQGGSTGLEQQKAKRYPKSKYKGIKVTITESLKKDFDFDLKFRVTGFTLATTYKGNYVEKKTRGASLTSEMKELVKDLPKGSTIFITNISAKGPDGKPRQLGALPVKLN